MGEEVTLAFSCRAETIFGYSIRVVGDCDALGNWNPARAPALTTDASEYPKWFGNIQCRAVPTEYKFVKFDEFQNAVWEEGDNRYFAVTDDGVVTRNGESGEPATPIFGVKDPSYVPRLASGRSRKTSFEDEVKEYAVPIPATPKNKVASGTAGFQDELHFKVVCAWTGMGDHVSVVGSCEELGHWDVKKGIKLCTSPDLYPTWAGVVHLQSCSFRDVEFKAVIVRLSSDDWESNHNRRLSLPADDEEGPWEAFLNFNLNGVKVAKFRSSPVQKPHDSKEDPAVVKAALQESMRLAAKQRGEQRRSTSLSLLSERAPLVAESWWRCRDLSGPSPKEQCLILKLKGIAESEAKKLFVELVFEATSQKATVSLDLSSWHHEELQAAWSLAVTAVELPAGIHFFHFRVNGVFALSGEHIRIGRWNALHQKEPLRRYLLARDSCGQLLEEGQMVEKTRSKRIGDMAFDSVVDDASSADGTGLQEGGGQIVRPYSVCGHLALGDSDGEHDNQDGASSFAPFAKEVYEGLFDRELMLRLDGVVLPEVPQPPLHLEGEDVGCALRLWAGAHLIKKAHGACEDAFFADPHGMGVADGVGCMVQFASYGINAAQYAAELMEFSSAALKPGGIASEDKIPNDVASRAAAAMQHGEFQAAAYGASTVAVLCQQGNFLGVANLGDSGFMVLRKGPRGMSIIVKSEEQQHSWNCPYQLTRLPKTLMNRFPKLQLDKARDCECYTVPIREGDLVIMFSDGLRDNLHDREVVSLVNRTLPPMCADLVGLLDRCTPPETIAKTLALAAQERSMDPSAKVPFVEYSKRHGFECIGGKQDDITVVAAWVVADESQPHPDDLDVDEIVEDMLLAEEEEEERLRLEEEERLRKEEEEKLRLEEEERLRKEEEERLRLEEEKLRKEEEERLRLQEEERLRLEEERLREEEEERLRLEEEERFRKEEEERLRLEEEERFRKEEEERLRLEEEERFRKQEEERLRLEEEERFRKEEEERLRLQEEERFRKEEEQRLLDQEEEAFDDGDKSPTPSNVSHEYTFAPEGEQGESKEDEGKNTRHRSGEKEDMAREGSGRIHAKKSSRKFQRKNKTQPLSQQMQGPRCHPAAPRMAANVQQQS